MVEKYLSFVTYNRYTVFITLLVVVFLLNKWTSILEKQLSLLWKKLKLSTSVRWATFDAISSSLPEFLTSLIWLLILKEKWLEVWIWTIWWSAIFNVLVIPALVLFFFKWKEINIDIKWIKRDSLFYMLSILIFVLWLYFEKLFLMWVLLVTLYVLYTLYLYKQNINHKKANTKEIEEIYKSVANQKVKIFNIFFSLFIIYVSIEASIVVVSFIWDKLHLSVLIVSLFLLAAITSVPDTLLSIKSAQKWHVDAWLSNAVWSNIFDICIWLWIPIVIWIWLLNLHPSIDFSSNIWVFIFLLISTFVYFYVLRNKNISYKDWFVLLAMYFLFIVYLIVVSTHLI